MDKKKRKLIQKKSNKIADDMIERHKQLKSKLDALKSKRVSEKVSKVQEVPKINPKSRRLASKSQTSLITAENRIRRTHEILKTSKFMPKKVKLSMDNLKFIPRTKNPTPRVLRYDSVFTSPLAQSPITFPSINCLTEFTCPDELEFLPHDILKRNKLLLSLKKESGQKTPEVDYLELPFEERTQIWLKKKQEKVNSMRVEKESKGVGDCTFRPSFASMPGSLKGSPRERSLMTTCTKKPERTQSQVSINSGRSSIISNKSHVEDNARVHRQFSTSGSSSTTLNNICPISLNISYHSGFSNSLRKKSKPMISYKVLNIKP